MYAPDIHGALPALFAGIEGPGGIQVHRAGQTAFVERRIVGFAHIHAPEKFRGKHAEVKIAGSRRAATLIYPRVGGKQGFQAIDAGAGKIRPEAAQGNLPPLTRVARYGHAGNALQGFGEVGIGKVRDIFGQNAVPGAYGGAF